MGGQACVLYGAAEFSRDTDFAILAAATNLTRLRTALADLQADVIAVPPLRLKYLQRGHAIHFRCQHPDARGMRVDVMSHMRGVDTLPHSGGVARPSNSGDPDKPWSAVTTTRPVAFVLESATST
jgi:hypothetical protein